MKYTVSDAVFEKYPNFCRGVVIAKDILNQGADGVLQEELLEISKSIRKNPELRNYKEHPKIESWRQAFQGFSFNPNANPPSIANLIKRVANGAKIPFISKVVTIFNIMSLKHVIPLGGDDLDSIKGDLLLDFAKGTEKYTPLGKPGTVEYPKPDEIIYYDTGDNTVLCRAWCWRNSDQTKILPTTQCIAINVDGLPPLSPMNIQAIAEELSDKIKQHCGGTTAQFFLSKENPSINFNV